MIGQAAHWRGSGDAGLDCVWVALSGVDRDLVHGVGIGLGCDGGQREEVMEAPGEVALEAAERSLVGLPFGAFAFEVGPGCEIVSWAGDRDDGQRGG